MGVVCVGVVWVPPAGPHTCLAAVAGSGRRHRNVGSRGYRARVDEQLILDTAEAAAPALRALARDILEAEARHLGVSLDAADVLLRRAEGMPALHLIAAADQLLEHLAAAEGTTVPDQGVIAVLARAGAQLLMSGIELDGIVAGAQPLHS
jgi:hypothetical protein